MLNIECKIQSATSIWSFGYSPYERYQLSQHARDLPSFIQAIDQFHCINLAAHGKVLKPATDLTTTHRMDHLDYLLDVFPGLYCQRVNSENSSIVYTVVRPVLLVNVVSPDIPTIAMSPKLGVNARNSPCLEGYEASRSPKDHSSNSKVRDPINVAETLSQLHPGLTENCLISCCGTDYKVDSLKAKSTLQYNRLDCEIHDTKVTKTRT